MAAPTHHPFPSPCLPCAIRDSIPSHPALRCAVGLEVTAYAAQKLMPPPSWQAWACGAVGHLGPGKVQEVELTPFFSQAETSPTSVAAPPPPLLAPALVLLAEKRATRQEDPLGQLSLRLQTPGAVMCNWPCLPHTSVGRALGTL